MPRSANPDRDGGRSYRIHGWPFQADRIAIRGVGRKSAFLDANVYSGSGMAPWAPALNGGSTIHSGPSRLDGSCALISGHSFEALQCRQSATNSHSAPTQIFPVSGHWTG